ncbi:hypothetical protein [Streptomyces sp. DH12]|uniref:hypothetical protein n=1 Tax=Streptomyces sp. DH12 TaxID=2857010 RepID=UPI001E539979|nr:hypothetical protein [Streptomyces sp. DH12]
MPLYERRDESHEVVERVRTVAGSREDRRLAGSGAWKRVEDEPAPSAEQQPAPTPAVKRTGKPAPAEG